MEEVPGELALAVKLRLGSAATRLDMAKPSFHVDCLDGPGRCCHYRDVYDEVTDALLAINLDEFGIPTEGSADSSD